MRKAEYPVSKIFLERWSPRAMSGGAIKREELLSLIEAARWAPSSYNNQPWRFLYALKDSTHWNAFFDLLVDFNKQWAKNAGALLVVCSKKTFDFNGNPSRTHAFDAGAAWENFALQGSVQGLVVHGMEGFDYDKARKILKVPDEYEIHAMIAVGKPGRKEDLPKEMQQNETPSDRKPLKDIAWEGGFTK